MSAPISSAPATPAGTGDDGDSAGTAGATASPAPKPGPLKRLYDWVLHWADTPYGLPALCLVSFAESSFFPIPPDVLLIALCMGATRKAFRYVFWCALFSVLGGALGYYIGLEFYETIGRKIIEGLHYEDAFRKVEVLYGDNAFWAILTAAFTPVPYKVFTIAAGVCHESVSLATLLVASALGRTGRFLLVGAAIYYFGPPVKRLLEKYLEWFCLAFMVLLIGCFALVKVVFGGDDKKPPAAAPAALPLTPELCPAHKQTVQDAPVVQAREP
ncbi:MAG: DedA family protein [Puniceicoccales bacterium]|jgi:membrane protein YqaA with SNARE-associated domain|nr:DedA family protein [Puniceicoccales bacterium]